MFTGIITHTGVVRALESGDGGAHVRIAADIGTLVEGASVACSGVCLTALRPDNAGFEADLSRETLARTTAADWRPGTRLNLERPLKVGDELGGHWVLGHVDGVAEVRERQPDGGSARLAVAVPPDLARFIAAKGSVTLDGVSLTVNEVAGAAFTVNVLPHTLAVTTLGKAGPGARVNLEIDMLARTVARLRETGA